MNKFTVGILAVAWLAIILWGIVVHNQAAEIETRNATDENGIVHYGLH